MIYLELNLKSGYTPLLCDENVINLKPGSIISLLFGFHLTFEYTAVSKGLVCESNKISLLNFELYLISRLLA